MVGANLRELLNVPQQRASEPVCLTLFDPLLELLWTASPNVKKKKKLSLAILCIIILYIAFHSRGTLILTRVRNRYMSSASRNLFFNPILQIHVVWINIRKDFMFFPSHIWWWHWQLEVFPPRQWIIQKVWFTKLVNKVKQIAGIFCRESMGKICQL